MANVLETIPELDDETEPSEIGFRFYIKPKAPTPDPIPDPEDPEGPMIQPPTPDNKLKARLFGEITMSFKRADGRQGRADAVHTFAMRPSGAHPNNLPGMTAAKATSLISVAKLMRAELMRLEGE